MASLKDSNEKLKKQLAEIKEKSDSSKVAEALPVPTDVPCHDVQPGNWVLIKEFRRKDCLSPRWNGPFQVLLTTNTAVKVAERDSWIHASHVRRTVDPHKLCEFASPDISPPTEPVSPEPEENDFLPLSEEEIESLLLNEGYTSSEIKDLDLVHYALTTGQIPSGPTSHVDISQESTPDLAIDPTGTLSEDGLIWLQGGNGIGTNTFLQLAEGFVFLQFADPVPQQGVERAVLQQQTSWDKIQLLDFIERRQGGSWSTHGDTHLEEHSLLHEEEGNSPPDVQSVQAGVCLRRMRFWEKDYLDNGSNKMAIQQADKLLKKHKDLHCAKVLKAIGLQRTGKQDEAFALAQEVTALEPTDDNSLQALTILYREMHRPELVTKLYEAAVKKVPNSEEYHSHLFMAYARVGEYKKMQQAGMALYKIVPKNPYYFWSVMSLIMQSISTQDENLSKTMFLPLAERMVEKMVKEDKIEADAEGIEEAGAAIHLPKEVDAGSDKSAPGPVIFQGPELLPLLPARLAEEWILGGGRQAPLKLQDLPFQLLYRRIPPPAGAPGVVTAEEPGAHLPHIPPSPRRGKGGPLPPPGLPELPEGRHEAHVLQQAIVKMPIGRPQPLRSQRGLHGHQMVVCERSRLNAGGVGSCQMES
ncbi:uncharacterized protein LOC102450730 [Pelodiscus sinensis]|uniref:uncharacterized protein LOC102450730 n=1 Tax=Pelodiscus sinensis TaxID=13735 RepID=UPI003F6B1EF3